MQKKHGSGSRAESFFAGKGFYLVLFLCVAVIGVSAWAMLADSKNTADIDYSQVLGEDPYSEAPMDMGKNDSANSDANENASEKNQSSEENAMAPSAEEELLAALPEEEVVSAPAEESVSAPISQEDASEETISAPDTESQETASWTEEEASSENVQPIFTWPIIGEVQTPYSVASLIYSKTMGDWRTHNGVDIQGELGAHVVAVSAGTVENIYTDDLYGVTVVIDHMDGLKSVYSNLAETPTVYVGDSVTAGEVIGAIGTTAICESGEEHHIHFSMTKDGAIVNPHEYLPQM